MESVSLLDIILAASLILLAWRLVTTPDLFKAAVLFITLSLLMALAWVRLKAPDIALAEAAIGAGITGILLIDTLGRLGPGRRGRGDGGGGQAG
ncbi:MAG: DUF4040 domain-containing protein [Deltaproteobacteria bacterium]|nr:DUF4040 domain-containing protein [Deltaproteobacteria bacterium]MCL4873889.1 DUF4040 domain-containing protein [bacterium]